MIPVTVVTGFLGSGKTTLLARLLRDPALSRTAVVINEFGEVGLDHDLIETSDESFVQLSTGCLCCQVRSDLVLTLCDLAARRRAGTLPAFERVVIETSGLADPAPILHALMTDRTLNEVCALDGVITTVDALSGGATLDRHRESVRQVAVADRIVLTKTDLVQQHPAGLERRLRRLNPGAPIVPSIRGAIPAALLFDAAGGARAGRYPGAAAWLTQAAEGDSGDHLHASHADDITSVAVLRDEPVHAATLALFLAALAENCGEDLLRTKGIVAVRERPECPAVVHGVQHVYHAPVWLPRWPSADRRTRLVFIGRALRASWIGSLLELLDAEVAAEAAARAGGGAEASPGKARARPAGPA